MFKEININAVINSVFVLLGVSLGFFLKYFSNKLSDKELIKKEFDMLKNEIYYEREKNKFDYRLDELKMLFIHNDKLLEEKANKMFFEKWLENPVGNWGKKRTNDMIGDLDKTRV